MADIDDQLDKTSSKLEKLDRELANLTKNLSSTSRSLLNNAKSTKDQDKISQLLIQSKQEELTSLRASDKYNTSAGKLKRFQLLNEVRDLRQHSSELRKSRTFTGRLGSSFTKVTRGIRAFDPRVYLATKAIEGLQAVVKEITGTISGVISGIAKTSLDMLDAEKGVKNFEDATKHFKDSFFLSKFADLGKTVDFNISNFKTLALRGADFESSVTGMRYAAARAEMPLLQFVDAVAKNSELFAQLGGSVQQGVRNFEILAPALRNITRSQLSQFGLNLEDTNEFLSSYLELERARGNVEAFTRDDLITRTAAYSKQLVLLAKLTGDDVKQIDARNRQQATNGRFMAILSGMTEEQANRMRSANSELGKINPLFSQLFEQVTGFGVATDHNTAMLNQFSGGGLIPAFRAFKNGEIGFTELFNRVGEGSRFLTQNNSAIARASFVTGEFVDILNAGAAGIRKIVNPDTLLKEIKARDTATGTIISAYDAFERTTAAFQKQTVDNLIGPMFGDKANGIYKNIIGKLDKTAVGLMNFNLLSSVIDAKRGMKVFIGNAVDSAKTIYNNITSGKNPFSGLTSRTPQKDFIVDDSEIPEFYAGSKGFRDFGAGTPAILHGKEIVQPLNSPMGRVIASLDGAKLEQSPQKVQNITNAVSNIAQGTGDFSQVVAAINSMANSLGSKADETINRLNMIAGASAKTADNTGKQIKTLARNPYSIV
jgi:hypothetical protein